MARKVLRNVIANSPPQSLACTVPEVSPQELRKAVTQAEKKLRRIIRLYGDEGGKRREPWYLTTLTMEALREMRLAAELTQLNKLREKGTKKDSPCQKTQGRPNPTPIVAQRR